MADNIFLLMGIQGSGKGTQADRLARQCGIPHISTGDIFRATMKGEGPLSEELRAILNRGDLVPDELTSRMVRERIAQPDAKTGFILDGYPRTEEQVKHLEAMLQETGRSITAVFFFDLPEEETVKRLSGRLICTKDQTHIYHAVTNPPKQEGVCDIDGAPLMQREDDKPEAIRKRVAEYKANTLPLLDIFRARGLVQTIDAMKSIDEVTVDVMRAAGC